VSLQPDHLVICVADLGEANVEFVDRFGLGSVPGGRHSGHGTENRIVPLGDSYIEMVAVVDASEAAFSQFGSWVQSKVAGPTGVDAVCLRTDDIVATSQRLEIEAVAMSRAKPDGATLAWRVAGIEQMIAEGLPFFIEWEGPEESLPGRTPIHHQAGSVGLDSVEVVGPLQRLQTWMTGARGVSIASGPPNIRAVVSSSQGPIQI